MNPKSSMNRLPVGVKGPGVPCLQALLAPCVEERIYSNTPVARCEKHQGTIGRFSNNRERTNHHFRGDCGCRAVNTSHF